MLTETNPNPVAGNNYKPRVANWTSIRLLNVYRLALSSIFVSQAFIQQSPLLNITDLRLYSWVSSAFLILSLIWTLAAWIERRGFHIQVALQVYSDITIIILLMHASGGISSGIGMLIIISIVVSGMLAERSLSFVFASLASLGLLAEYIFSSINAVNYAGTTTQVGILGATLFATAFVTHKLMSRLQSSEQLVKQRERDVAQLSALNQEIIENMHAGVIVLGRGYAIQHINQSAMQMLHLQDERTVSLVLDAPKLLATLKSWHQDPSRSTPFLPSETNIDNYQVNFHSLKSGQNENTLILLNDVSSIKSSMQQAKLASLGHLTASIAHEIRNPLGAISYAAQLLYENKALAESEHRMTEIIHQHTQRINHIIEDILQISRGSSHTPEPLNLNAWLNKFIPDFCLIEQIDSDKIKLEFAGRIDTILFDSGHFEQIMTNLCSNAHNHGDAEKNIYVKVYTCPAGILNIEIADQGPGIKREDMDRIFEPFFTTSHRGSGLGLYIVNQLCDLNNAAISVHRNSYNGTSFIIKPSLSRPKSIHPKTT